MPTKPLSSPRRASSPKRPRYRDQKWRRLRAWLREVQSDAEKGQAQPFGRYAYYSARAEAFRAVLIVMDMESRRSRRRALNTSLPTGKAK